MYNKVEALREKGIAEKMILGDDYVSARDRLLRSRQLFPTLDHIVPMLTVCDILAASKCKNPSYGTDYYWILQIFPSCSEFDVKLRCDKLVSLLQPIKSKFSGTEMALKLVQEASSVLSDPSKRLTFDMKRSSSWKDIESSCMKSVPALTASDQVSSGQTISDEADFLNSGHKHVDMSILESASFSSDLNSEAHQKEDTIILDDMDSKRKRSKVIRPRMLDQDFYSFESTRAAENIKTGQIWAVHHGLEESKVYRYAQINGLTESKASVKWLKPVPGSEDEERWCSAGLPVACGPFWLDVEACEEVDCPRSFSYNCSWVPGVSQEKIEIYPKNGEVWTIYDDWDFDDWSYNPQIFKENKFKLVEFLSDFSKYLGAECASLVKVDGFKSIFERQTDEEGDLVTCHISPRNLYMLSHLVPSYRFTGGEIEGVVNGMFELDRLALKNETRKSVDRQTMAKNENLDNSHCSSLIPNSMTLRPRWTPNDFAIGQVWAIYCGKDLLPKQYARIENVIMVSDRVIVTLLEPQPNSDFKFSLKGNVDVVCGIFEANETKVCLEMWQLSHRVKCQQSTSRAMYKIYPNKGEIWAMYQNHNIAYNNGTSSENFECCIVEILSDLFEGEKMRIAKLEEVQGCLTFFQRLQLDGFDMSRTVSKSEIYSFSHRIPAFRVPGIGEHGIPENSWHLEPNALPLNNGSFWYIVFGFNLYRHKRGGYQCQLSTDKRHNVQRSSLSKGMNPSSRLETADQRQADRRAFARCSHLVLPLGVGGTATMLE